MYDKLIAKVSVIDTSGFVLKTQYDTDKSYLGKKINHPDKKIPVISGLVEKQIIMQKLLRQKAKYLVLLVSLPLLHWTQLKIRHLTLVIQLKNKLWHKNVRHWEKIFYFTPDYNKVTHDILYAKIKEKRLVDKSFLAGFTNNTDLNKNYTTLATKGEQKAEQDKIANLQEFNSSCFCGKSYFEDDGTQSYLVFQPV